MTPCWRLLFCLLGGVLLPMPALQAAAIFTHPSPESDQDTRALYYRDVLQLALEKTLDSHGDYQLRPAPQMNRVRLRLEVRMGTYPNFFSADSQRTPDEMLFLDYVPFPAELGILGYRICFVSPQREREVANVTRLEQLQALQHGQGRGWQDVFILRHAGMQVQEVDSYERLFKLVSRGRIDLFCRGANELYTELEQRPELGLRVDKQVLIHYPFPHFFYTHKDNKQGVIRITKGLQLAWLDGSLQKLWASYFRAGLERANLPARQLFELENPLLTPLGVDLTPYQYDPIRQQFGKATP